MAIPCLLSVGTSFGALGNLIILLGAFQLLASRDGVWRSLSKGANAICALAPMLRVFHKP